MIIPAIVHGYTFADIGDRLASALKATIRVSAFEGAAVIAQIIGDNGHAIQLSLVLNCSRNRMWWSGRPCSRAPLHNRVRYRRRGVVLFIAVGYQG